MHTFVTNAKSLSHFCNLIAALSDLFNGFNFELIGITLFTHNSPHFYLLLYSYEMSTKVGPYQAIESNDAPDSPLAGMTASDEKRDEAEATEETTTTVSDPILQSSVLKVSVALEQLAKNAGPSYQKGNTEAEGVKRIQQALLNMDFNLGSAKV
jgi:hypothetical protein